MYEQIRMMLQSTIREFEDLRKKLNERADQKVIDELFDNILHRARLLNDFQVKGAKRFYFKVFALKKMTDNSFKNALELPTRFIMKLIDYRLKSMEKRVIKLRDKSLRADISDSLNLIELKI